MGRAPISSSSMSSSSMSSSYRARRVRPGMGLPWFKIGAAGAGTLLLVAIGGWAISHRHPAAIPVIEADARPLRVKPDNPGGLQVAGADEKDEGGGERMVPPAEAPAPQALRAQIQPPAAPPVPVAAPSASPAPAPTLAPAAAPGPVTASVAETPVAPAPPGKPGRGARPLVPGTASPATGAPAVPPASATTASPALPTAAAPPSPVHAGATLVQLGALGSEAAAQAEWQRLAHAAPDLVSGRQPSIQKTEHDGKTLWRLRTGGFSDVADATGFCAKLRAKGAACTIASF